MMMRTDKQFTDTGKLNIFFAVEPNGRCFDEASDGTLIKLGIITIGLFVRQPKCGFVEFCCCCYCQLKC